MSQTSTKDNIKDSWTQIDKGDIPAKESTLKIVKSCSNCLLHPVISKTSTKENKKDSWIRQKDRGKLKWYLKKESCPNYMIIKLNLAHFLTSNHEQNFNKRQHKWWYPC